MINKKIVAVSQYKDTPAREMYAKLDNESWSLMDESEGVTRRIMRLVAPMIFPNTDWKDLPPAADKNEEQPDSKVARLNEEFAAFNVRTITVDSQLRLIDGMDKLDLETVQGLAQWVIESGIVDTFDLDGYAPFAILTSDAMISRTITVLGDDVERLERVNSRVSEMLGGNEGDIARGGLRESFQMLGSPERATFQAGDVITVSSESLG